MFERLLWKLGRYGARPPITGPLNGSKVWSFARPKREGDRDRIREDIEKRGLSFGEMRLEYSLFGIKFVMPPSISLTDAAAALAQVVGDATYPGLTVISRVDDHGGAAIVTLGADAPAELGCVWSSGVSGGEAFEHRVFIDVNRFGDYPVSIEVYSPEATEMAMRLAERLGVRTGPATYAYESDVPLSRIVTATVRWKDTSSGAHYVETTIRDQTLVKHSYWRGVTRSYEVPSDDGTKTVVLAASGWFPTYNINNTDVPTSRVSYPTPNMIAARKKFRGDARHVCAVKGCGQRATRGVRVTLSRTVGFGGSSSHGRTFYVCDSAEHAKTIMDHAPGYGHEIRPIERETW